MKRDELIKAKLSEKQSVDLDEIKEDDLHSLKRLKSDEEDNLRTVTKSIKRYLENHTLTLGSEFLTLKEKEQSIKVRIKLIDKIIEEYV